KPRTDRRFLPDLVTSEGQVALLEPVPVPRGRPERYDDGCTISGMPAGAAKILIPRWIQLVGLPLMLLFLWVLAGAVRHVIFLFLVALLIALLLSPVVRLVQRVRIPRGFAVAIVYLVFALALIAAIGAIGT